MLAHYGVVADPCRVGDPNRKGTVENAIQHTQATALKGRRFDSIEAQNAWLAHWEERWAALRIHGRKKRQVLEMYREEQPASAAVAASRGSATSSRARAPSTTPGSCRSTAPTTRRCPPPRTARSPCASTSARSRSWMPTGQLLRRHEKSARKGEFVIGRRRSALQSLARERARCSPRPSASARTPRRSPASSSPASVVPGSARSTGWRTSPATTPAPTSSGVRAAARGAVLLLRRRQARAGAPEAAIAAAAGPPPLTQTGPAHPRAHRIPIVLGDATPRLTHRRTPMAMSITELERSLRALRLSGMSATLQARALAVASHEMDFIEAFSWLVQDELDRRRSRLLDRRYTLSGTARAQGPQGLRLELQPDASRSARCSSWPPSSSSTRARTRCSSAARHRQEPHRQGARAARRQPRLQGPLPRSPSADRGHQRGARAGRASASCAPSSRPQSCSSSTICSCASSQPNAGDELADVLMSRYEKASTIITSNRALEDWAKLLGDVVRRHAAARPAHAPRTPAQVRRQELATEGGRRARCQARINRVKSPRPVAGGGGV